MMRFVLALWCVGALCVALTNPLGEAPDEQAHFDYVRFLVHTHRLPVQCASPCVSDVPGEGHQPPLAYVLAALVTWPLFDTGEWVPQALNPHFIWQGGTDAQALIHGTREQWPWQGTFLAWRLIRLISLLWVMLGLWLIWLSARTLTPPVVALGTVAVLAASPQLAFIGGSVSNDGLLFALAAAATYLMITATALRGVVWLSIVIALALITKQSAIVLLPMLIWPLWRIHPFTQRLKGAAIASILLVGIAGWWYGRNLLWYGDIFGFTLFRQTYQNMTLDFTTLATWQSAWQQLMRSAWGVYGWMSITAPSWWYLITTTISIIGICGVGIVLMTRLRHIPARWWGLAFVVTITSAWLVMFAATVGAVAWQTRLAIPAIPACAILVAGGLQYGFRITYTTRHVLIAVVCMALCQQWIWWYAVLPRFPLHMPAPALTAQALATPTEAVFAAPTAGGGIALLDYTLTGTLAPASTIDVTARWQALSRAPVAWSVFIWIVNEQKVVFVQQTQPLFPMIPTTAWSPGDRVYSTHQFVIPADLPAGNYVIQFGLVDPLTDTRAHRRSYAEKLMGDSVRIPFTIVR